MSLKSKILLRISLALILSTVFIVAIVAVHIRIATLDSAKQKATLIAEVTRDALTAHMLNGMMDKRDVFLSNLSHLKGVEKLWIVRSQTVINQFGKAHANEIPRDAVDMDVLKSGKIVQSVDENIFAADLRISIPYIASSSVGSPNCLECHNAREGEVLGVISMQFNLGETKTTGVETIGKIAFISILSLLIIILMTNAFLNPYLNLFGQLTQKIKDAHDGNYKERIATTLKDEAGEVAIWFNELMQKLDATFVEIERRITEFISVRAIDRDGNPLETTRKVVKDLSEIYKFKRTIENDETKMEIYDRIVRLLDQKFNIKNFTIYEVDPEKKLRSVLIQNGEKSCCSLASLENSLLCRSNRIAKSIFSDDFENVCPQFECDGLFYVCMPVSIGGKVGIVINFMAQNEEEQEHIKASLPKIQNYLNEASSVIESRRLMDMMRETTLRDPMTNLYNRRFLEEYLQKTVPLIVRNKHTLAILMVDMDHFKMVNDTYGHDVGDKLLKELAKVLAENVRAADLVIRYGGEEFLILLHDVKSEEDATLVAEKLRSKTKEIKIKVGNEVLQKTVSIGISIFPSDADTIWKCVKYADVAMYWAKELGRDKVIRFLPEMWSDTDY